MKKIILFLILPFLTAIALQAQIIIDQSDMPHPGDTLRVSITNNVPNSYAKTAMDTTWNFAALEALSQRVDTFVVATSTPAIYQLFFVLTGGANLASPRSSSPIPGLPISQGFTFYKNSSGSFTDLGSAYTVQGLPLPAKYDTPEMLYKFPVSPGTTWSSVSSFAINVPGLAYYSTNRSRTNLVDGWGNVTTPYGTFPCLRIKSTLHVHDSIYIDSLSIGFPFNRDIIEYKWLSKGKGIPILQVNEEGSLVTATYRDIVRMSAQPLTVDLGKDTAVLKGTMLTIHATIAGGTPPYQVFWSTLDTGYNITVNVQSIQTYTILVVDALQNMAVDQIIVSIKYPPGFRDAIPSPFTIYPNPSQGILHVSDPGIIGPLEMQVISMMGETLIRTTITPPAAVDLSKLPDGLFIVRLSAGKQAWSTKLNLLR